MQLLSENDILYRQNRCFDPAVRSVDRSVLTDERGEKRDER